jgi:hypothetical protein
VLALLVCSLLLRQQLENREEYLRFWDRLLAGRSAMVLSVSPQDRVSLASSLYPLVWVAGHYGVDATMQGDSLADARPEAASSVQVSYATPSGTAADGRLRWTLAGPPDQLAQAQRPIQKSLRQLFWIEKSRMETLQQVRLSPRRRCLAFFPRILPPFTSKVPTPMPFAICSNG